MGTAVPQAHSVLWISRELQSQGLNALHFISSKCILNQCQAGCKTDVTNFIATLAIPLSQQYLSQLHMINIKKLSEISYLRSSLR